MMKIELVWFSVALLCRAASGLDYNPQYGNCIWH